MSYVLRDGSVVQDPRLGCIKKKDPRDKNYPARALLGVKPRPRRSYTWRCDTWLDQGMEGACVAFAFNHELIAAPRVLRRSNEEAREDYYGIQRMDEWDGGAWPGAEPFYEGTSPRAGAQYMVRQGHYVEYRHCFSEEDMALVVGYKGPVVCGFNWYEGMMVPQLGSNVIAPTGELMGRHATLFRGYNKHTGYYRVRNSWNRSWGHEGDCFIHQTYVRQLLQDEDGDAIVVVRSGR